MGNDFLSHKFTFHIFAYLKISNGNWLHGRYVAVPFFLAFIIMDEPLWRAFIAANLDSSSSNVKH